MQLGKAGLDLIVEFEGYHTKLPNGDCQAYWDTTGKVWTIGWGCTEGVKQGEVWTRQMALYRFHAELKKHFKFVQKQAPWANQNEFDALASFSYNGGPGMLRQLLRRYPDKQAIADAFMLFEYSGGVKLRGLTRRRRAERELFLTPAKTTLLRRFAEKRAANKAAAKEAAPLASKVDDWLDYILPGGFSLGYVLERIGAIVVDWRTLAVVCGATSLWVGVKTLKWYARKRYGIPTIPAADKPKKRKAA